MTSATLFERPGPLEDPLTPPAAARHVELVPLPARTALTDQRRSDRRNASGPRSTRWFDWSGNPYRGCEFGCVYCYARSTHEYLGQEDPRAFQERIFVKQGYDEALRRDLRGRVRPGDHVALGTATDPYQPAERRERVTRRALRELQGVVGVRLSITTKGTLVVRDVELLRKLARRNQVRVNMTITTPDRRLARFLEPRAPAPTRRFAALARLREAGIEAGVFLMPVLPGVTDRDGDLADLYARARAAGALYVAHQVVFLREPSRSYFLRELKTRYPRVAARYAVWTHTASRLPEAVRSDVRERVDELARRFGLPPQPCGPAAENDGPVQRVFGFARGPQLESRASPSQESPESDGRTTRDTH